MKIGDLIRVTFISHHGTLLPTVGIVFFSQQRNNTKNYFDIKMLCNTGEIRELVLGYGGAVEIIQ